MNNFEVTYLTGISQVPDAVFDSLGCDRSFYFSKEFLTVFEKSNPAISYHYLVFESEGTAVALAIIQSLDVALSSATENVPLSTRIARSLKCYLNGRNIHIMVCGNVFLSGNYGICIREGIPQSKVYEDLARAMKLMKSEKKASVFFLKDFNTSQLVPAQNVEGNQFQSFAVEPNMRLHVQWDSFDAYKESLRSKYRVKVNKADSRSEALTTRYLAVDEIREYAERLQQLYRNITDKATFNAVEIEIETYAGLKERFRESVFVNTYWLGDQIIGFAAAFRVGDILDAHFIGMDYTRNKEYAVYPRILNDYIRMGIDLGVKEINFGRTASEIKSTIGAVPESLTCYVRHRRTVANLLFKPLVRQIKMTDYKQHRPFKA
ncbi:MAG: hypothetical protein ACI828_000044 [Flavobacteriales bacterium]